MSLPYSNIIGANVFEGSFGVLRYLETILNHLETIWKENFEFEILMIFFIKSTPRLDVVLGTKELVLTIFEKSRIFNKRLSGIHNIGGPIIAAGILNMLGGPSIQNGGSSGHFEHIKKCSRNPPSEPLLPVLCTKEPGLEKCDFWKNSNFRPAVIKYPRCRVSNHCYGLSKHAWGSQDPKGW